ncbi:anthranilate synthase component I [Helicobacter pylori]|nr:anthranilate synthase component I [Helicobacter pylori]WRC15850.1 anthranilate synthase component I [Helicobacter pylori]WRD12147.1 anthranilate synthase component I [Helicobacter pylori]
MLQKSGLDIDDKKAFEIESEAAHQTPFNGSSFLKRICKHNIVKSLA